jgi:hypothetical protein
MKEKSILFMIGHTYWKYASCWKLITTVTWRNSWRGTHMCDESREASLSHVPSHWSISGSCKGYFSLHAQVLASAQRFALACYSARESHMLCEVLPLLHLVNSEVPHHYYLLTVCKGNMEMMHVLSFILSLKAADLKIADFYIFY